MDYFFSTMGGTEGQLYNLIRNIDKNLFEPELCLFRDINNFFENNSFPCTVFFLGIKSFYSFSSYLKLIKLRKYIRRNRIDIVQIMFNDAALSVPLVTIGLPVKTISTRRDMGFWYTPVNLLMLRLNSLLTDKYLANSYAVKNNVKRKECVPDEKIEVIYNTHNLLRFLAKGKQNFLEQQSIPEGSELIGIVANFRPVKRVSDLIIAFADVLKKHQDSYLILVGDPIHLLYEYIKLTRELGIANRVRFLGEIQDVIPIIKCFTVGVNCSESEGLSNVLIEYMGCGVPVIATDTSGNRELIKDGEMGLLVPVGNPKELTSAILKILENNNLRQKVIQTSSKFIAEKFKENIIIEQYQRFYLNLLNNTIEQ